MDMRGIFGSFSPFGGFGSHGEEPEPDFEEMVDEPPPPPVGQDERRMQVRAYNHWASMLGERNFPAIEDLDPNDLPDFGPYSVLLDFSGGIENPSVPFLGDRLAAECGAGAAISRLDDVPSLSLLSRITAHYMQILANQAPIGFEAEFVNARGLTVLYRGILLPFSSDDETIDHIYGVINWKELADQQTADALLLEIDSALAAGRAAAPVLDLGQIGVWADEDGQEDDELAEWEEGPIDLAATADDAGNGQTLFIQPEFGDEELSAEHYEEGDDEDEDEHLPSLVAMRIDKSERRKAPAVLDLRTVAPVALRVVNGSMPLFEDYDAAALDTSCDVEAFAAPMLTDSFDHTPAGGGGTEWTGGNLPVLHSAGAMPPAQADTPAAMLQRIATAMEAGEEATGLHGCLASARELADTLRNSEDRTRATLYRAVSRAYDVSLAAADAPEEFAELLADSGLAMQDRAPMTPVVKLVFGADYDKTRIAEYAAVLANAQRRGIERGGLRDVLQDSKGGLKAIVAEERALRRAEEGKAAASVPVLSGRLAGRLRTAEPVPFDELPAVGPEFALAVVRRLPGGGLAVVGEVPEDRRLLEKAARRLLG